MPAVKAQFTKAGKTGGLIPLPHPQDISLLDFPLSPVSVFIPLFLHLHVSIQQEQE